METKGSGNEKSVNVNSRYDFFYKYIINQCSGIKSSTL